MTAQLQPDNANVVISTFDCDETKMARRAAILFGAIERAVTDHHHPIGGVPLEKRMSKKNCFFHATGSVSGSYIARQLAQPSLVRRKRLQQPWLRAGADDHNLLMRRQTIDQ